MKVKRFKNLWTMGLILCGAILVFFYVAKIFFPEFIVGVAEIPSIVKFGNYVDSHWWSLHLFNATCAFIGLYVYCCACCRIALLSKINTIILIIVIIILEIISKFLPTQYIPINYATFSFLPFVMCCVDKKLNKETFISCSICFFCDIMAQCLSVFIRDVVVIANTLNSATFLILLIDTWIWRWLLYSFFNYNKTQGG